MWYLIVSIPDLCTFTYFNKRLRILNKAFLLLRKVMGKHSLWFESVWPLFNFTLKDMTPYWKKLLFNLSPAYWVIFHAFVVVCWLFFKINLFKKLFQEHYQSVKWSGSKPFTKVFSRRQKSPVGDKQTCLLFCGKRYIHIVYLLRLLKFQNFDRMIRKRRFSGLVLQWLGSD